MNREAQNDRAKLILHRLVARRLKAEPQLVDHARLLLREWKTARPDPSSGDWVEAWERVLQQPIEQIRTEIVRRSERADWLRATSPFALVPGLMPDDIAVRKRIWRIAKRGSTAALRTSFERSGP